MSDLQTLVHPVLQEKKEDQTSQRPWGMYTILDKASAYLVKRIVVEPGKRLSLQMHNHRDEHWVMVKGQGVVILDESSIRLQVGDRIFIPRFSRHRIENKTDDSLVFIEVQLGDYLEEDDIVRFEDDYGRIPVCQET